MGVSQRGAVVLTIVGMALIVTGVACMFWQLALILAGTFLAIIGLVGVDVKEGQ